ncbi:hypothetical protein [Mycolicibacterium fortuitum]|uniref:hypothetical protein n=1 Tax=Mycolicibacterium fortuitum TaxID=1766 RepID=UPI00096DC69D|nr:hypothetical protein [Mycolicibacterium fortuitum]OMC12999.1 hypothetical protein A5734_20975 [Mycolicibacterium fortuitum]
MRTFGSVHIFGRSAIADASPEPKEIELHLALRPYVTAGVALVGASVIAATPVIAPPAPIQPQTHTIELTAAVDPLTQWAGIITRTVTEASQFAQTIAADPAPILQQITQNQLGNAQTVSNALQAFADGAGAMLDPSRPGGTVYLLIEAVRHLQQGDPVAASQAAWNGILGFLYQALPLSKLTSIQATMATNFGKRSRNWPSCRTRSGSSVSVLPTHHSRRSRKPAPPSCRHSLTTIPLLPPLHSSASRAQSWTTP